MTKKEKTPKTKTRKKYEGLVAGKWALYGGTYLCPLIPACVLTGINWEEWFCQDRVSLGMGFGMLLVSVLSTMYAIMKKDKVVNDFITPLFVVTVIALLWGVSFWLLGSVSIELGKMIVYTAIGLFCSAVCDQVNKSVVNKNIDFYKKEMSNSGMELGTEKKAKRIEELKEQIRKDAEEEEKYRGRL